MFSLHTIEVTAQRLEETQRAILEQRAHVARLDDPALKVIAGRTLRTLEDMLVIMQRTHGLLVESAYLSESQLPEPPLDEPARAPGRPINVNLPA